MVFKPTRSRCRSRERPHGVKARGGGRSRHGDVLGLRRRLWDGEETAHEGPEPVRRPAATVCIARCLAVRRSRLMDDRRRLDRGRPLRESITAMRDFTVIIGVPTRGGPGARVGLPRLSLRRTARGARSDGPAVQASARNGHPQYLAGGLVTPSSDTAPPLTFRSLFGRPPDLPRGSMMASTSAETTRCRDR